MTTKEQLISLAKEKGFESKAYKSHIIELILNAENVAKSINVSVNGDFKELSYYLWMCELQKWLREKHNIYVESLPYNDTELEQTLWENNIIDVKDDWSEFGDYTYYHSYEEALEAGLIEALKLIK